MALDRTRDFSLMMTPQFGAQIKVLSGVKKFEKKSILHLQ